MKKITIVILLGMLCFTACKKEEEKEVCSTCTLYDDVNQTSGNVHSVCLKKSTMDYYIDELYKSNSATQHWVCTEPR